MEPIHKAHYFFDIKLIRMDYLFHVPTVQVLIIEFLGNVEVIAYPRVEVNEFIRMKTYFCMTLEDYSNTLCRGHNT